MNVDNASLISTLNAFKNNSVQRGNLHLPTSLTANQVWTDSISFTLTEAAAFLQAYIFSTDYAQYFDFADGQYHDSWRNIHTNADHLVFTVSAGILNFQVRMALSGTTATFTLFLKNGSTATNVTHPNFLIPVTFIDYSLAN